MEIDVSELNTDVLEQIFRWFTSLETLKAARLVSRNWYTSSASIWSFYKTVKLLQTHDDSEPSDENVTLKVFKDIREAEIGDEDAIPSRRFVLKDWRFDDNHFEQDCQTDNDILKLSKWFWKDSGSLLTSITFQRCHFSENATVFKECFLTAVPNLARLSLDSCEFGAGASEELKSCGFSTLGYQHLNLKTLTIRQVKAEYLNGAVHMFITMLPNLERIVASDLDWSTPPFTFTKIKSLDILGLNQSVIESFPIGPSKASGSLEDFQLDIGVNNDKRDLIRLIERHSKSLKRLHLYRAPFSEPFCDFSLQLAQLKHLKLSGNVVNSLALLAGLSNLQSLTIHTASRSKNLVTQLNQGRKRYPLFNTDFIENTPQDCVFNSLLKFNIDSGPISENSWERLVKIMPNVEDLSAVITCSSVLDVISEHWKNLHRLELNHGSMIEHGIGKLKHLSKFIWRGCPCTKNIPKEIQDQLEDELVGIIRWDSHVILPWMTNLTHICVDAEFRRLLTKPNDS